jgi:thiol-disulfide isomerase/thioredoxin
MLRPVLFAAAVMALVVPAQAADPDLSGNWLVSFSTGVGVEQALVIVKVEMKDGKPTISTVGPGLTASDIVIDNGKTIKFHLNKDYVVEGNIGSDGNVVGSFTSDQFAYRARLSKTDKTEITINDRIIRSDVPAPASETKDLLQSINTLRTAANREKAADKKKEINEKIVSTQKELDAKLREVITKLPNTVFALDAALDLLRNASRAKVTPAEAKTLFAQVEKAALDYGPLYARSITLQLAESLANLKGFDAVSIPVAEQFYKALTRKDTLAYQSRVLGLYKAALESAATPDKDTLKTVAMSLGKVEAEIDAEYAKKVPPFKPVTFAGRKETAANQVVVMELFTGAQCPPCVAADVAFDALQKSYKPTELVLIQYHLHIPGPDPLTNLDTLARAKYYNVNSTPTTLFNGKSQAAGGGGMANSESKFKQYTGIIDPLLEKTTDVKVSGKATRTGEKLAIAVEVAGAEGDDMKLRLLVVEETIKYVGGNQLRFHHQVVRSMPGGAEGVAIKDKAFKHTAAVDLSDIRKSLTTYLDDYAANSSPFPKPQRPMDLKSLRVIALVQNDKTKEIVQALQIETEGKLGAASGGE